MKKKKVHLQNDTPRQVLIRVYGWVILLGFMVVVSLLKLQPFLGFHLSSTQQIDIFLLFVFCTQVRWLIFKRWEWISRHEIAIANYLMKLEAWQRPFRLSLLKNISNVAKPALKVTKFSDNDFQRDRLVTRYLCLSAAFATIPLIWLTFSLFRHDARGLLYPFLGIVAMTMFFGLSLVEQKSVEKARRGDEGEEKIAKLLEPSMQQQGGTLYSRLYDNRLRIPGFGDLDILLTMPSGESFAISVKMLDGEKVKVFYDSAAQALRYRKGRTEKKKRPGKQNFDAEPTIELRKRVERLLADKKVLIGQSPVMLVVFPSPVLVDVHENSPTARVGEQPFLCINGVFVVMEKDLLFFVKHFLQTG